MMRGRTRLWKGPSGEQTFGPQRSLRRRPPPPPAARAPLMTVCLPAGQAVLETLLPQLY